MIWETFLLKALLATLLLQGVVLWACGYALPANRWLGAFALILGVATSYAFFSDRFVLSPEFGVLLMEGGAFRIVSLYALIISFSIATGVGWFGAAQLHRQASRPVWLISLSVAVGVLATNFFGSEFLDIAPTGSISTASEPEQISYYNVFSAPLLIWIGFSVFTLALVTICKLSATWRKDKAPPIGITIVAIALTFVIAALADMFYFDRFGATLALSGFLVGVILIVGVLGKGSLLSVSQSVLDLKPRIRTYLTLTWSEIRNRSPSIFSSTSSALSRLKNFSNFFFVLLSALFIGIALIAANEWPNRGKTILQPFATVMVKADIDSSAKDSDKGKVEKGALHAHELGLVIPDLVAAASAEIQKNVQPDLVTVGDTHHLVTVGDTHRGTYFVMANAGTNGFDTVFAKSSGLEFAGVKIPLEAIIFPIQSPLRRLFGIKVIHGTFLADHRTASLLASNEDRSWKAEINLDNSSREIVSEGGETPQLGNSAVLLANQLAFELYTTDDASLTSMGMTKSWGAFKQFTDGLRDWKDFESRRDYEQLQKSIEKFRAATRIDPNFALGFYRLGRALQEDGQPASAIEAFRGSSIADRDFLPAKIALAATLYNFEIYRKRTAAAASPDTLSKNDRKAMRGEAESLWHAIIRTQLRTLSTDLAFAYSGLCLKAYDDARTSNKAGDFYHAYYYCTRAKNLFVLLPTATRTAANIRNEEAHVLNTIAVVLSTPDRKSGPLKEQVWLCNGLGAQDEERSVDNNWLAAVALRYFEKARSLIPDDPVIRCNTATAALASGDPAPMKRLDSESTAHVLLGSQYRDQKAYQSALAEIERAIELQPNSVEALNNYAYTFWHWRHSNPREGSPDGPDAYIADKAESYARKAVKLAANQVDLAQEAMVRSTLGEVLLGKGRPNEAAEVLEKAVSIISKHPIFDEARWDLAQAYLCAASNEQDAGAPENHIRELRHKAATQLENIQAHDRTREDKLFPMMGRELDPARTPLVCKSSQRPMIEHKVNGQVMFYKLDTPKYEHHSTACKWSGVLAEVETQGSQIATQGYNFQVHVWGGEIDGWIFVNEKVQDDVLLSYSPRATNEYYFAQLYDDQMRPISPVYSIETFANSSEDDCPKNRIDLVFTTAFEEEPSLP